MTNGNDGSVLYTNEEAIERLAEEGVRDFLRAWRERLRKLQRTLLWLKGCLVGWFFFFVVFVFSTYSDVGFRSILSVLLFVLLGFPWVVFLHLAKKVEMLMRESEEIVGHYAEFCRQMALHVFVGDLKRATIAFRLLQEGLKPEE